MTGTMKIGGAILLGLGALYLYNKNKKTLARDATISAGEEKSNFSGLSFKGSQAWADALAAKWCRLKHTIDGVTSSSRGSHLSGYGALHDLANAKAEANSILGLLTSYGYAIYKCKALKAQNGYRWVNGDKVGNDCYCNGGFGPDCCKKYGK